MTDEARRVVIALLAYVASEADGHVRLEVGGFPGPFGPGDRGPLVERFQRALVAAGESLPRYGADGDFGGETRAAAERWAASRGGLAPGGVVTARLWAELVGPAELWDVRSGQDGVEVVRLRPAAGGWESGPVEHYPADVGALLAAAAARLLAAA